MKTYVLTPYLIGQEWRRQVLNFALILGAGVDLGKACVFAVALDSPDVFWGQVQTVVLR